MNKFLSTLYEVIFITCVFAFCFLPLFLGV